jgi:hypothetical protein
MTIREFVDAILAFIGASSVTDSEFELITEEDEVYSPELYAQMLAVLDTRELVSNTRDRLTYYFQAANATINETDAGVSKIFLGDDLCS